MKPHCFRLRRGEDLYLSLKSYVSKNNIKAATIISAVGCVSRACLRDASGVNIRAIEEHMEIVSVIGTLSDNRVHLHASFSKEDLSTIGGHLVEGCVINTTAEIVLLEMPEYEFEKEYDEETGYNELVIHRR
ncbi:PPC domain-containing DNA-binding protein [Anaeromicropila herbilytica]|uniref:DNA-binding protein n=1 Tax=Anaeromicropila herbilytica TaxID=2785025 RepID=A0A7R7EIR0_9FIRM|nr:PPC domain-containing DNA-binding protein [Anaeromicropila herbilytica]BCN29484.1 DNA-binding protein [Anaeromicropila herbilytica]